MAKLSAVFLFLATLYILNNVDAQSNTTPSSGLDYKEMVNVLIKKMMDSSTQTPSLMPHKREHITSPHKQNDHGTNDGSHQSSDFEKTLKMILMKLRYSTSTHNPKNVNNGDVDYYQGRDQNNNEMFMKMIHSNSDENKHSGQYKNHPGSHGDNHGQNGNIPSQYGNNYDQYGNNYGQSGNNPGQFGNSPGHFPKNTEQFVNDNRGPYSNPTQYGNNQGSFNRNSGQYGNNPGAFNSNSGQYGSNQGLFNSNQGLYGNNKQQFNPNQRQYGNNQGAFNPNSGQYGNNPGQFNHNPGQYNAQLQGITTTTVAPSTTSPTLAALEDQRRKQSIQQGIAIPLGILTSLRQTLTGGSSLG